MFIRIIEGKVADPDGLRRQQQRFVQTVKGSLVGYLGSTFGITSDGGVFVAVRLDSAESVAKNLSLPERVEWWAETEKCFAEPPIFTESSDVAEIMGGGSDSARFVQVMKMTVSSRGDLEALDAKFDVIVGEAPEIIGAVRAWTSDTTCIDINYFTSEAEARKGEAQEMSDEAKAVFADFQRVATAVEYIDLVDLILDSA